jgi:hypothetical protein
MNRFMNFCSLEPTPEIVPSDEEIARMINFATSLKEGTRQTLLAA